VTVVVDGLGGCLDPTATGPYGESKSGKRGEDSEEEDRGPARPLA
jgi:hypothetical protein